MSANSIVESYLTELHAFISEASKSKLGFGPRRAGHVCTDIIRSYIRYAIYGCGADRKENVLVIASIDIVETSRNTGIFKQILSRLAEENDKYDTIVVECVHEPNLAFALQRYGFVHDDLRPNNWYATTDQINIPQHSGNKLRYVT